jgi:hypothetical protein
MDLGSVYIVTNNAAQVQADLPPVYLHGPGQCQLFVCLGIQRARYLLYSLKWPSRTQAGSLPTCPMDPGQAKAQAD